jgi:hypothetical protein
MSFICLRGDLLWRMGADFAALPEEILMQADVREEDPELACLGATGPCALMLLSECVDMKSLSEAEDSNSLKMTCSSVEMLDDDLARFSSELHFDIP